MWHGQSVDSPYAIWNPEHIRACPPPQSLLCLRTEQLANSGIHLFSGILVMAAKA